MKKVLIFSLVLFMVAPFAVPNIFAAEISDIDNHKNKTAIKYLIDNNVAQGYKDGTFKPNLTINRAEFTKIITEATYDKTIIDNCLTKQMKPDWTYTFFPDVDRNAWFAKYICVAKTKGVINGYSDGLFKPNDKINKAEAIKIIVSSKGYSVPKSISGTLYSDVEESDWFAPYVKVAMDNNLLEDTGSSALHSDEFLTRGGMSEMTYRALVAKGKSFDEKTETSSLPASEKKVTASDPSEAEDELTKIVLNLLNTDPDSDIDDKILDLLDTPEINYTKNQLLIEQVSDEIEYGKEGNPFPNKYPIRQLMYFPADLGTKTKNVTSFYHDDKKAYVGVTSTIEGDNPLNVNTTFFTCYPFVFNGSWKLKLPNDFAGQVDFTTKGLIDSCAKEIKQDSLLSKDDLTLVNIDYYAYFPARFYLNGYLIENISSKMSKTNSLALPLISGKNNLEIIPAYDKDYQNPMTLKEYEESIKAVWGESGYKNLFSDVEPNEFKLSIEGSGSKKITEVSTFDQSEKVTKDFTFQP